MPKSIQIRNVPDSLYRLIKEQAEDAGLSISDYSLLQLRQHEEMETRPTLAAMRRRMHQRGPVLAPIDTARLVRDERDRH